MLALSWFVIQLMVTNNRAALCIDMYHPKATNGGSPLCHCCFQALIGAQLEIPTLTGRVITLPFTDIIKPGSTRRVQGEGLPYPKQPLQRGDLIVEFDIQFPDQLSDRTKRILSAELPETK